MSFDALAAHYRWMERVLAGNKLQRCRTAYLAQVAASQNVLLLGEGNGRFLVECRRALPAARLTCLDASGPMLALARRRLRRLDPTTAGVEFVHADVLEWTPPAPAFDLIVTHFFLDCFRPEQLERIVASIASAASARAVWLLADFAVPSRGLARCRAQIIHRMMYAFFRAATRLPARALTPPDDFLRSNHFVLRDRARSEWGLLHSDRWERGGR
ncbi:MAG: class I SAM-dependent methyltransferase [Verrucomicrobia bacterium]|nr:class I SAM-dependent methyltransferase [Verrucomicrobiota bacterium]